MNIEKSKPIAYICVLLQKMMPYLQSVSGTIPKWENISAILLWKRLIRNM